ncbi:MAG: four helix bundle protein [Candidatus Staskawiczbacteria bacterium]|nr:four helix bundle protein [Candidatus Staskawiczbacteria bacterium]
MIHTYKDLIVWQKSMELVVEIYFLTDQFPKEEIYGLTSQIRRSAVSIPSNIAEGKLRNSRKECRQFFLIAFGSGGELETQIEIAKRLPKTKSLNFNQVDLLLIEIMKILNKMIFNLSSLQPKA